MNRIIVDTKEFNLEFMEDTFLEIRSDTIINIKIIENNHKLLILSHNNHIEINTSLDKNDLVINSLGLNSSIDYNLNIINDSSIIISDSILAIDNSINNINIKCLGQNNYSKISTNGINLKNNKLYFILNGYVLKDSVNSTLDENSTIINILDGDSIIIPNLIIDTKEVIANHSAYIGTFDKEKLCYLMSRGIEEDEVKDLLLKSILLKDLNVAKEEYLDNINKFLKEYINKFGGE